MCGWIGSAMRPRPWYGCSAPFMGESLTQGTLFIAAPRPAGPQPRDGRRRALLSHGIEPVAIDRGHGDDAHLVVTLDGELDEVAGATRPELLVELLLRGDFHAVHPHDPVASTEAGAQGGADRRELADHDALRQRDRVEAEPRARRPAVDPAVRDQLVLHRREPLDGDREVHV